MFTSPRLQALSRNSCDVCECLGRCCLVCSRLDQLLRHPITFSPNICCISVTARSHAMTVLSSVDIRYHHTSPPTIHYTLTLLCNTCAEIDCQVGCVVNNLLRVILVASSKLDC